MHVVTIHPPELFGALSDSTRLRIVRLLATTGEESCLCEMVDSLLEPQYKLSRHLKILRQCGLLATQKEGRWVYHRLVTGPPYLTRLYAMVKLLPDVDADFAKDLARFHSRMGLRQAGRCHVGIRTPELTAGGT